MPPRTSPQLRRILLRSFCSTAEPHLPNRLHTSHLPSGCLFKLNHVFHRAPFSWNQSLSSFPKPFSSLPSKLGEQDHSNLLLAQSLSAELLKPQNESESLALGQRLDLSFSHISLSPTLIRATLNSSAEAGRTMLDFLKWVESKRGSQQFDLNDEVYSLFTDYFGRRKDFKVIDEILTAGKGVIGLDTFTSLVDRYVRAGRPGHVVSLFERMEKDFGIKRTREGLNIVVSKLCEHGHASCAEKMVKNLANEYFPDEHMCDLLIKGWCVDEKLDEARRLAREMYRGGFEVGVNGYNAILDCVCKLCRKKGLPFQLKSEAEKLLVDMDAVGVPRNVETFNVLIENLCKIRQTEDAMKLFDRMGEWGCHPDATTFLLLTRSLYQAARIGEGDEMLDRMKSAGYGEALDKKAYYGFLKILCGIERIDHALAVFAKMKEDGCKPGVKTYELLRERLWAHNRIDKANALLKEASENGVQLEGNKGYKVDLRFVKKSSKVVRKVKKRLTLPEKTALKRKKLRKLRLSYVKKSKPMMRRMF